MSCSAATLWRRIGDVRCRAYQPFRLGHYMPVVANRKFSMRHLWSRFMGQDPGGNGKAVGSTAMQHQRISERAQRDAMLHNERMLDACLDLLAFCGGSNPRAIRRMGSQDGLDATSLDTIAAVVEATLHDVRKTPAEQFDLVYAALCLPVVSSNRQLQRCLMVVLEAFLPEALFRVFESIDLAVVEPEGAARRDILLRFVHALLGCVEIPDGVESEEVVLVYLDDVRTAFPLLGVNPAFVELEKNATLIAMKARLYALLSRLCAEFDMEGTGKIDLCELRETAGRVLGEDQAHMLLDGAQPDKDGKIRYTQLMSLLTRPPPRQS